MACPCSRTRARAGGPVRLAPSRDDALSVEVRAFTGAAVSRTLPPLPPPPSDAWLRSNGTALARMYASVFGPWGAPLLRSSAGALAVPTPWRQQQQQQ